MISRTKIKERMDRAGRTTVPYEDRMNECSESFECILDDVLEHLPKFDIGQEVWFICSEDVAMPLVISAITITKYLTLYSGEGAYCEIPESNLYTTREEAEKEMGK